MTPSDGASSSPLHGRPVAHALACHHQPAPPYSRDFRPRVSLQTPLLAARDTLGSGLSLSAAEYEVMAGPQLLRAAGRQ